MTTVHGAVALSFVIPSVPGFPTSPLLPATTYVVLPNENHMQLTEAATLDRKSGEAEGSAVPQTSAGNAEYYTQNKIVISTGAKRSGEICGFLLLFTQILKPS